LDRDRNQTGVLFKSHHERGFDLAKFADASEHKCCSDVWVTGKRNLSDGGEDSYMPRVTGLRRKNERGLGEIELTRDLLHLLCRKTVCVRQHSQLISTEARLGENVTGVIAILHGALIEFPKVSDKVIKKTERRFFI
jgi:hypothetical protein